MKKLVRKFIAFILTLIMGGVLTIFGLAYLYTKDTTVLEKTGIVQEVTTIDTNILKDKLTNVGELVTQDYDYTALQTYTNQKEIEKFNFKIPFTKNGFTLQYEGTIKAGIDFTAIKIDCDDESKTLTLTVPKAKIISSEIDEDSLKVLDRKNGVFNALKIEDFQDARVELKAKSEQEALDKGLLTKAQKNAETVLKGLIMSLPNIENYTVKIVTEK